VARQPHGGASIVAAAAKLNPFGLGMWKQELSGNTPPIRVILPSETQSREFEAKLLLALALAERGVPTYVGSRMAIHNAIHTFPASIYVAKDFRKPSNRIFNIMRDLGHHIVAWDEEAVLFFNAQEFHERRVHAPTYGMVEALFAWGPENGSYLRTAPGYDGRTPIHDVGNPRLDMLRRELHAYYDVEVEKLKARFGPFVLVNTNFGKLNHAVASYVVRPGGTDKSVGGAITPFMQRAWTHRLGIFESFKKMVPFLANNLPGRSIIIRPHPAENHQTWRDVAAGFENVHVIHEGPVQNWLLAADALVHNGCTTGIEGYLMGIPVVAYMELQDSKFDLALANDLSEKVNSLDDLLARLNELQRKSPEPPTQSEKASRLGAFFSGLSGPLASDQMADIICNYAKAWPPHPTTRVGRIQATAHARGRAAVKWIASHWQDHKNSKAYSLQRFPGIEATEVEACIRRFQLTLGRFQSAKCSPISRNIFMIS
jgi:surface carbohydrate biosynthesis protein